MTIRPKPVLEIITVEKDGTETLQFSARIDPRGRHAVQLRPGGLYHADLSPSPKPDVAQQ